MRMDSHEKLLLEPQELNLAILLHLQRQLAHGSSPHSLRLCPDVATILTDTPIEKLVRLCRINQALFIPSTEVLRDAIEQMSEAPLASVKEQLLSAL